jgi:hypothetical protein
MFSKSAIVTGAAILLIFAAGVGTGALFERGPVRNDRASQATVSAPAMTERWYIWLDEAPLIGEPFPSESECQAERRTRLEQAKQDAQGEIERIGPLSIREINALGYDPRQRIAEHFEQIQRAYCHVSV